MFLKVYFLNFRYFFIVKKQQLVLYSYITYREIENNQPGSGAFARFPHPHPGEFTKEMLMPGGQPGGGWALLELTDALQLKCVIAVALLLHLNLSVPLWKDISHYVQDSMANVSHLPAVNDRIQRGIKKHKGPSIQIKSLHRDCTFTEYTQN